MNGSTLRFMEVISLLGLKTKDLTKIEGIQRQVLYKIKKGIQEVSIGQIEPLCLLYSQINTDYIVTGRGAPINGSETESNSEYMQMAKTAIEAMKLQAESLKTKDAQIQELINELKSQKGGVADARGAAIRREALG